ncbi:MAG TPA: YkvA family protein [Polyangiaceae bacterium]|nr:YkvA family protein [Polyangiaceae bacterium]
MSSFETRCLDSFSAWLRTLGDDARALAGVLESDAPEALSRAAARALVYVVKSVDLIPDGLEDLGYLDDAFVVRVAAGAVGEGELPPDREREPGATVHRLAADAALVREFLGETFEALAAHVAELDQRVVRGRTVDGVLGDAEARAALVREAREFAGSYAVPAFTRDEKNLVKLRAYFGAKLKAS